MFALSAEGTLIFQEIGEPHWGHQVFFVPLQPDGDEGQNLNSITFGTLPHQLFALRANGHEQINNGVTMHARYAFSGADAHAFNQKIEAH